MILRLYRWKRPAIKTKFSWATICAALLCIVVNAHADRQPGSLSTVKLSASSQNIEIIHRLHNHDAELGVIVAMNDRSLSIDQLVGRAQLALYVEERFTIAAVDDAKIGAPLNLKLIGAEVDGEFILVYQEYTGTLPKRVAVKNDILRDVFPEQVNHVNIALNGKVRSLTFKDDDRWLSTRLD